ncbi:hypothetical protein GCM10025771_42030 [Niveibacterium umoris]|uniref:Phage infection protein n=1 Tax=Niveibacterium umoris TaxID=1193620 RepID=A0A840BWW3_9RHOO|nr:hypothetical protein [Niveibacterium umoris]MBB4014797.1 hypothetical protein [Niveibacterium umoris]
MNTKLGLMAVLLASLPVAAAVADDANMLDRNVKQEQRIEQGLQSGSLNTKEAARLEKGEARIDQMEARAARDGKIGKNEAARIRQAQDAESRAIHDEKHDAQRGNPNSASSRRMQADVQRDINQQSRIRNGVADGSLTTHEAGRMERQQAHDDRLQARAGADGHVGAHEQRHIAMSEDRSSRHIWRQRHDAQHN